MTRSTEDPLPSWRRGAAKDAVLDFVRRTTGEDGSIPVPVEERVAVFDNDGTLWCKKPAPIQLYFVLGRLAEMAEAGRSCGSASPGRPRTRTTAAGSRRWSPRTKSDWTKVF